MPKAQATVAQTHFCECRPSLIYCIQTSSLPASPALPMTSIPALEAHHEDIIQSPDRLYKAPIDYTKPQKYYTKPDKLYKAPGRPYTNPIRQRPEILNEDLKC